MVRMVSTHVLLIGVAGAVCASPAFAKGPKPSFTIEPIIARNLLAPADLPRNAWAPRLSMIDVERAGLVEPPPYRLEREGDAVAGKRARLSVAIGETRVFAMGGRLSRRERPGPPDAGETSRATTLASRRLESGRLYGAGLERTFGAINVVAAYQYSRINGAELDPTSDNAVMRIDDKSQSHSLMLSARLSF
jgi:hypothetical protein